MIIINGAKVDCMAYMASDVIVNEIVLNKLNFVYNVIEATNSIAAPPQSS